MNIPLPAPLPMTTFGQEFDRDQAREERRRQQALANEMMRAKMHSMPEQQALRNRLLQAQAASAEAQIPLRQAMAKRYESLSQPGGTGNVQMSISPGGQLQFTAGAVQSHAGAAPSVSSNLANASLNSQGGVVPIPGFGSRSGGRTLIDTNTGGAISTPTTRTSSAEQATLIGAGRARPQVEQILQTLPQFLTAAQKYKLKTHQWMNYLGLSDNASPSQFALGQSALRRAPEGILKAYGVSPTDSNLKAMKESIEPVFGETSGGYKGRIFKTLDDLKQNEMSARKQLRGGFPLGGQASMVIPSFASKEDFRKWFNGLSPEMKAQARQRMGKK